MLARPERSVESRGATCQEARSSGEAARRQTATTEGKLTQVMSTVCQMSTQVMYQLLVMTALSSDVSTMRDLSENVDSYNVITLSV